MSFRIATIFTLIVIIVCSGSNGLNTRDATNTIDQTTTNNQTIFAINNSTNPFLTNIAAYVSRRYETIKNISMPIINQIQSKILQLVLLYGYIPIQGADNYLLILNNMYKFDVKLLFMHITKVNKYARYSKLIYFTYYNALLAGVEYVLGERKQIVSHESLFIWINLSLLIILFQFFKIALNVIFYIGLKNKRKLIFVAITILIYILGKIVIILIMLMYIGYRLFKYSLMQLIPLTIFIFMIDTLPAMALTCYQYYNYIVVLSNYPKDCYEAMRSTDLTIQYLLPLARQMGICKHTRYGLIKHLTILSVDLLIKLFLNEYTVLTYILILFFILTFRHQLFLIFGYFINLYRYPEIIRPFNVFKFSMYHYDLRFSYEYFLLVANCRNPTDALNILPLLTARYHKDAGVPPKLMKPPKNEVLPQNISGHELEAHQRSKYYSYVMSNLNQDPVNKLAAFTHRDVHNGYGNKLSDSKYTLNVNEFSGHTVVYLLDNIFKLSEQQLLQLLIDNKYVVSYHGVPTDKYLVAAKLKNDKIEMKLDIPSGEIVTETINLKYYKETFTFDTPFAQYVIVTKSINIGDHHICTRFNLAGVFPPQTYDHALIKSNFLLILNHRFALFVNAEGRFIRITRTQADALKHKSHYDSSVTSLNNEADSANGFNLNKYLTGSEVAQEIKKIGHIPTLDVTWNDPYLIEQIVEEVKITELHVQKPEPIKRVIESTVPPSLCTTLPVTENAKPNLTQAGPINGSTPNGTANAAETAFVMRYLFPPSVNLKAIKQIDIVKHVTDFKNEMFKQIPAGSLVPNEELRKQKHKDVIDSTKSKTTNSTKKLFITETFTKGETYANAMSYFRAISNQSKLLVALFTPYTAVLQSTFSKYVPWYAPGKAQYGLDKVTNTVGLDFSKYEASQSLWSRIVESIFPEFFINGKQAEFRDLLFKEYNNKFKFDDVTRMQKKLKVKTTKVFIHSLGKRLSGSAITTLGNTTVAGFLQYLYYVVAEELSPAEAYSKIKLSYGDDGLFPRGKLNAFIEFAALLGFKITIEPHREIGLKTFCGKVMDGMGKTSTDACRHINKFFSSWSHYGQTTNMLLKWAGFHAEAVGKCVTELNIFQAIGEIASKILRKVDDKKYSDIIKNNFKESEEYKISQNSNKGDNATFDQIFGAEKENLLFLIRDSSKYQTGEQFIEHINTVIGPFVPKMMNLTELKPGILSLNNVPILSNTEYKDFKTSKLYEQVKLFNYGAEVLNQLYGRKVVNFVRFDAYIKDAINIANDVGVTVIEDQVFKESRGSVNREDESKTKQTTKQTKTDETKKRFVKVWNK